MSVSTGRPADFLDPGAHTPGAAFLASSPQAVANCLAMLEGEAQALGLPLVAALIGAAHLAAQEESERLEILAAARTPACGPMGALLDERCCASS